MEDMERGLIFWGPFPLRGANERNGTWQKREFGWAPRVRWRWCGEYYAKRQRCRHGCMGKILRWQRMGA